MKKFIEDKGGSIVNKNVSLPLNKLYVRKERGGNNKISGYKINPLFFVYVKDSVVKDGILTFKLDKVRQLNPTIAAKVFFNKLKYNEVKEYYNF